VTELITEQRATVYKLLSECYRSPDETYTGVVSQLQEVLNEFDPGGVNIPDLAEMAGKVSADELKVEHARLFLGPFKLLAPPYGSMYLDSSDLLMTDSARDALRWYESEGMDLALHDMPDHIRVELEFMYYLVFLELKSAELSGSYGNRNSNSASGEKKTPVEVSEDRTKRKLRQKQRDFLLNHLGRWIRGFEQKVLENSRSDYFIRLASLTADFVARDLKNLTHTD
jgi:putative dimethyl sulfoxide reductase chaperone